MKTLLLAVTAVAILAFSSGCASRTGVSTPVGGVSAGAAVY
ncbi:MAG: hypothetical protein ACO1QR_09445 [Chthoniobacteraceae bacterium]